jgi:hypothetical protein
VTVFMPLVSPLTSLALLVPSGDATRRCWDGRDRPAASGAASASGATAAAVKHHKKCRKAKHRRHCRKRRI